MNYAMEAISTNKKTFQLQENGQLIGELLYESLFFRNAEIKLSDAECYVIKPQGVFETTFSLSKNATDIATFGMNWRGHIEFVMADGQEFVLKGKGFFHNKYILENKAGEVLMFFKPEFVWRKFRYNYCIYFDKIPLKNHLVLFAVYATNYIISTASSASSGMG